MPANAVDIIPPPTGMGTDIPAADLPKNFCQYARGFVPGRNGKLALAPLIKRVQKSLGITIYGTAVWQSEAGIGDRLLLFSSTTVYSLLLSSNTLTDVPWIVDERADGPHSYYAFGALTTVTTHGQSAAIQDGVYSIQFHDELIVSIGGTLFRYYVTLDGTGTEKWYSLGLTTPAAPTLTQSTGGSLVPGATYSYEYTWEDELGRESSPSAATSITLSSSNNQVTVTKTTSAPTTQGATYWNVYRLNPGADTYKFVAQVAAATGTYSDTASDSVVNTGDSAPEDGENDPPFSSDATPGVAGSANQFAVWKNRLVLNSLNDPNLVQVSNAGSPTQFSSLPLPTHLADGLRIAVGGHGQNQVTGLANLGSLLCVFGRETTSLLYGDDISDFTLRETLQRGCQNPNSIQRCENEVYFLSDDGIYAIGYESGYAVAKRSVPIDDLFRGFEWTKQVDSPTSKWRWQASEVTNAPNTNVNSFYSDNRYYLSLYNKTICMDVRTGGWTDTGWGFIKTASRYYSQQTDISTTWAAGRLASAPETIFLTFGDPTTWAAELDYFTSADTPDDRDTTPPRTAELIGRPIGADPTVQVRSRRVTWLSQYGQTSAKRGEQIGTVTWHVDGQSFAKRPIYAHVVTRRHGALFETTAPIMTGEVIYPTFEFSVRDLHLENAVCELVYTN